MAIAALVFAALAALLHIYIFYMESLAWTTPRVRRVFGFSEEKADATKELAFNQGFYNLFLAIATIAGIVFYAMGEHAIGATLIFVGAGSMLAAALVLLVSNPKSARAAITQGTFPLLAAALLTLALLA